jgi:hypothetical protein
MVATVATIAVAAMVRQMRAKARKPALESDMKQAYSCQNLWQGAR